MPQKNVAVLDFGSEKLTIAVGSSGINGTLNIKGVGQSGYAGFLNGEFLEPEKLKLAIESAISSVKDSCKFECDKIYVGVPAEFGFVTTNVSSQNYGKQKLIKKSDVSEIFAKADVSARFKEHTKINETAIYFVLDNNAKHQNPIGFETSAMGGLISFFFADNNFINLVKQSLISLGYDSIEFLSESLAESLYLLNDEVRDKYAIIIDSGYITTSVCLVRGGGLLNMFSFSMGGGNLTSDLSECLQITFADAEILKRKIVVSMQPKDEDMYDINVDGKILPISQSTANDIVDSRIEVISKAILKCFESFDYEFPEKTPIYLTGGGLSYIKGAKDRLSKYIGKNIELLIPPEPELNKPHLSSVLSLLYMAIIQNKLKNESFFSKLKNFIKRILGK